VSEWRLIETAPSAVRVELGRWDQSYRGGSPVWETTFGIAYEPSFFGVFKVPTYEGKRYTHWRHPPEPPKD
jgi:hypothetical protein